MRCIGSRNSLPGLWLRPWRKPTSTQSSLLHLDHGDRRLDHPALDLPDGQQPQRPRRKCLAAQGWAGNGRRGREFKTLATTAVALHALHGWYFSARRVS